MATRCEAPVEPRSIRVEGVGEADDPHGSSPAAAVASPSSCVVPRNRDVIDLHAPSRLPTTVRQAPGRRAFQPPGARALRGSSAQSPERRRRAPRPTTAGIQPPTSSTLATRAPSPTARPDTRVPASRPTPPMRGIPNRVNLLRAGPPRAMSHQAPPSAGPRPQAGCEPRPAQHAGDGQQPRR